MDEYFWGARTLARVRAHQGFEGDFIMEYKKGVRDSQAYLVPTDLFSALSDSRVSGASSFDWNEARDSLLLYQIRAWN